MNSGIKFETSCRHCGAEIRRNNLDLQQILCKKEEELNKTRATLDGIREERDQLRRKVHIILCELDDLKSTKGQSGQLDENKTSSNAVSISRKAGRVKLKKTSPTKSNEIQNLETRLLGKDLDPSRLSTGVTEQLILDINASSTFHEISNSASTDTIISQRFELELERVNSQCDNLKSENNLLNLTLQESKSKMEQLHMLLTKFESNNSAYSTTLLHSELISESYGALLSISEKEIVNPEFFKDVSHNKPMHRKRIRNALGDLKRFLQDNSIVSSFSKTWNDSDQAEESLLTHSDVITLMDLCKKAEDRKRAVKRSIVNLDSFSIESLQAPSHSSKYKRAVTEIDLENAVLLHELTRVKEELVNLKCEYKKSNDSKKEFTSNLLCEDNPKVFGKVSPAASHDCAFGESILSSEGDIEYERNRKPAFLSLADLRIGTMTESEIGTELSESLKREQRLKKECERLSFTLQQVQQNSEKRHSTSLEVMSNLKTAYSTLLENGRSDKFKLKFRIQELEQVISSLEEHYKIKISELFRKILMYERERENSILPDNETAL